MIVKPAKKAVAVVAFIDVAEDDVTLGTSSQAGQRIALQALLPQDQRQLLARPQAIPVLSTL